MIRLVDNPALFPLPDHPYLAPLIETEIACYGGTSGLLLWVQEGRNRAPVAQIARLDSFAAVFASQDANFDELGDFLDRVGWSSAEAVPAMAPFLAGTQEQATILVLEGEPPAFAGSRPVPLTAGQLFPVAAACFPGVREARGPWMVHFSLLLRRHRAQAFGFLEGGQTVCAGAITHTGGGRGIIGYIATLPGWRGKGLAGRMTTFLAGECRRQGLVPVLASRPETEELYCTCGFRPWGTLLTAAAPDPVPVPAPNREI